MVHVPILKIDIPEPRLTDLIPSTIELIINTLTSIHDRVDDFINPVPPEHAELFSELAVGAIPREFRKARKRLIEKKEKDEAKISEELEDATFAYYRRSMRESWVGYSDELPEEVGFRRLIDGDSPSQEVRDRYEFEQEQRLLDDGLPPAMEALLFRADSEVPASADAEAAQPVEQPADEEEIRLASRRHQLATTTAVGGAGAVLGIGALRLLQLIRKLSKRGSKKGPKTAKQQAAAGGKVRKGSKGAQQQHQRAVKPKAKEPSKRRIQR